MRAGQWLKIKVISWNPRELERICHSRNIQCEVKRTAKKTLEGIRGNLFLGDLNLGKNFNEIIKPELAISNL